MCKVFRLLLLLSSGCFGMSGMPDLLNHQVLLPDLFWPGLCVGHTHCTGLA